MSQSCHPAEVLRKNQTSIFTCVADDCPSLSPACLPPLHSVHELLWDEVGGHGKPNRRKKTSDVHLSSSMYPLCPLCACCDIMVWGAAAAKRFQPGAGFEAKLAQDGNVRVDKQPRLRLTWPPAIIDQKDLEGIHHMHLLLPPTGPFLMELHDCVVLYISGDSFSFSCCCLGKPLWVQCFRVGWTLHLLYPLKPLLHYVKSLCCTVSMPAYHGVVA